MVLEEKLIKKDSLVPILIIKERVDEIEYTEESYWITKNETVQHIKYSIFSSK